LKQLHYIIKDSIKGNETAQRALYLEYRVRWYMQCLRYGKNKYEADDILQEGLVQIFNDLKQYDPKRSKFITWSSRVISHAALKYLKKNNWYETLTDIEEAYELKETTETVYDKLAAQELTAIIQTLPIGYRLVFNMYVIEDYTHKEIAKQLGIAEGTSKSQLSKAKKMIREKIEYHLTEYTTK